MVLTVFVSLAFADSDGDGYSTTGVVKDCDDSNSSVNPAATEIPGDRVDQDCDGLDGLKRWFIQSKFVSLGWSATGPVTFGVDTITVGDMSGSSSVVHRSVSAIGKGHIYAAVQVDSRTGTHCGLQLKTQRAGPPVPQRIEFSGTGTQILDFSGLLDPPRTLVDVEISCPAYNSVTIDWISLQDSPDEVFPPEGDFHVDWTDVGMPAGGYSTSVVRAGSDGVLFAASDVGGVAEHDPGSYPGYWRTISGRGKTGMTEMAVWDVAAVDWDGDPAGDHEVYALTGTLMPVGGRSNGDLFGGLWRSDDDGITWDRVADTLADGIGDYGRESDCGTSEYGSGRMLLPDEDSHAIFVASNWEHTVYDADGDDPADWYRQTGVYLWDDSIGDLCRDGAGWPEAIPGLDGDHLLGALAMGETPDGTRTLIVGYRSPEANVDALYLCELPATIGCSDIASVTCTAYPEFEGVDVRDIEVDPDPQEMDRFFVASGSDARPEVDGSYVCTAQDGAVYEGAIDDSGTGGVVPGTARLVSDTRWDSPANGIVGVSMDPDANFLYAFIPGAPVPTAAEILRGGTYYRIAEDDIGDTGAWQSGEQAGDGADLQANTDYGGAWLEADTVATPVPYPYLWSPGFALDATWYEGDEAEERAVVTTFNNLWDVEGLADPSGTWDPEDSTYWTFWPSVAPFSGSENWQTMSEPDIAVDGHGNVFMPMGDHGLLELPDGAPAAERDCIFDMFGAGGSRVSVDANGESVWVALYEQSANVPHNIGIFKTGTLPSYPAGSIWSYQGSAWNVANTRDATTHAAVCRDQGAIYPGHYAQALGTGTDFAWDTGGIYAGDPSGPDFTDPCLASWGDPWDIDALDNDVAVAAFASYDADTSQCQTLSEEQHYTVAGRLAYTLDGGVTWTRIDFDGDADPETEGDECDAYDFFRGPVVSLVHPGADTYWVDNDDSGDVSEGDDWKIDLVVGARSLVRECTFARVTVSPTDPGTWHWGTLDYDASSAYGGCQVDARNFKGLVTSPWADELYVWGTYSTAGRTPPLAEHGGVCAIHLDDSDPSNFNPVASMLSPVGTDNRYEFDVEDVVPHPNVADLVLVVPTFTDTSLQMCENNLIRGGIEICPRSPDPVLLERSGDSSSPWNASFLPDPPPAPSGSAAAWSDADANTAGRIYYATAGSGAWRGTVTW